MKESVPWTSLPGVYSKFDPTWVTVPRRADEAMPTSVTESPSASMPSNGMGIVTLCPATVRATTSFGRGAVFVSSSMATTVRLTTAEATLPAVSETV